MTIRELIEALETLEADYVGHDHQVYLGNYYQDRPVERVEIHNGYPLLFSQDII